MRPVLLGALALALSPVLASAAPSPGRAQWGRGRPERFALSGRVTQLEIATYYGSVTVEPGPDRSLHVELTKLTRMGIDQAAAERAAQVRLQPKVKAGALSLCTYGEEGAKGWGELVDYEVRVLTPTSWRAGAKGSSAPRLRVRSREGNICLRRLRGRQEIQATSGSVELEGLRGAAEVGTVEGDVTGTDLAWDQAVVHSSGGNLTLGVSALPAQADLQLSSAIGNLRLALPSGAACQVEADTTAGRVVTEIPRLKSGLRYGDRSLRGSLGQGTARVKLQSTRGRIEIVQSSP